MRRQKLQIKMCVFLKNFIKISFNLQNDEIEIFKNEYEALNFQVKSSLPKLICTINKVCKIL